MFTEKAIKESMTQFIFLRRKVAIEEPFFAVLAMQFQPMIACPHHLSLCWCAATDGRHFIMNPDGWLSIPVEERMWTLKHEIMHCVLRHITRLQARDPILWNIVCDFVVNLLLYQMKCGVPAYALFDQQWLGMAADTIYEKVKTSLPPPPRGSSSLDAFMKYCTDQFGKSPKTMMLDHDIENDGSPMEPIKADIVRNNIESTWRKAVKTAISVSKNKGSLPGNFDQMIDAEQTPRLPWIRLLNQWVQKRIRTGYRWTQPNKRWIGDNIYLPSRSRPSLGTIIIGVDTSGSVGDELLGEFLSEVRGVLDAYPCNIYLVGIDASAHYIGSWTDATDFPDEIEVTGRGGTDFRPFFTWIADHHGPERSEEDGSEDYPALAIYLTDGMGEYPDEQPHGYDVLWVLSADYQQDSPYYPPFGHVIVAFSDVG
jgi:predicted metal-dependent peptidase